MPLARLDALVGLVADRMPGASAGGSEGMTTSKAGPSMPWAAGSVKSGTNGNNSTKVLGQP
jgi:hypothetical protein